MNEEIIVAVYDTEAHADAAVRDLEAAHVPPTAITRHAGGPAASGTPGSSGNPAGQGFWSSLFGGEPDHDNSVYDRSLESRSSVVTVRVPDEHVDRVTEILERHHPIDIDERAASFGLGANRSATAPAGTRGAHGAALRDGDEEVIPISEEQLTIGKRLVNRPPTRIRPFVVETPGGARVCKRRMTTRPAALAAPPRFQHRRPVRRSDQSIAMRPGCAAPRVK